MRKGGVAFQIKILNGFKVEPPLAAKGVKDRELVLDESGRRAGLRLERGLVERLLMHRPSSFAGSFENSNAPFPSGRTTIASPSPNFPSSTAIASGF